MERCSRCGEEYIRVAMSYMNTDIICDNCKKIEQEHPLYNFARLAKARESKTNIKYPGLFAGQKYPFDLRG